MNICKYCDELIPLKQLYQYAPLPSVQFTTYTEVENYHEDSDGNMYPCGAYDEANSDFRNLYEMEKLKYQIELDKYKMMTYS